MTRPSHLRLVKSGPTPPRLSVSKPVDLALRCGAALILLGLLVLCVLMVVQIVLESALGSIFVRSA